MTLKEFKALILKVTLTHHHTLTNTLGTYDIYKIMRKNKWLGINTNVLERPYYDIIRTLNTALADTLLTSGEVKLPCNMGTVFIRKVNRRFINDDGTFNKLKCIDWETTLNLWYEDEEARLLKILVWFETPIIFNVHYNKKRATYNNKKFFTFRLVRKKQREMAALIKKNKLECFNTSYYD